MANSECLPNWPTTPHQDPGLRLFDLSRPLLPQMRGRVLEIGYRDTPWARWALRADPSLQITAIDWRKAMPSAGLETVQGDILAQSYRSGSWDCIVGLSSFEHIGLGHYELDPLYDDGDVQLGRKIREWLRPGGWCYFDVPYDPTGYRVQGSKCRIYDDTALAQRFGPLSILGYVTSSVNGWIEKPTEAVVSGRRKFYYVACLIRA